MTIESELTSAWSEIESTWGETVYLLPWGDSGGQFTAQAVVNRRSEEGSNEIRGDGRSFDKRDGKEIRKSLTIDLDKSHGVQEDVRDPWQVVIFESSAEATAFGGGDRTVGQVYRIKRRVSSTRDSERFLCIRIPGGGIQRRIRPKG